MGSNSNIKVFKSHGGHGLHGLGGRACCSAHGFGHAGGAIVCSTDGCDGCEKTHECKLEDCPGPESCGNMHIDTTVEVDDDGKTKTITKKIIKRGNTDSEDVKIIVETEEDKE